MAPTRSRDPSDEAEAPCAAERSNGRGHQPGLPSWWPWWWSSGYWPEAVDCGVERAIPASRSARVPPQPSAF